MYRSVAFRLHEFDNRFAMSKIQKRWKIFMRQKWNKIKLRQKRVLQTDVTVITNDKNFSLLIYLLVRARVEYSILALFHILLVLFYVFSSFLFIYRFFSVFVDPAPTFSEQPLSLYLKLASSALFFRDLFICFFFYFMYWFVIFSSDLVADFKLVPGGFVTS